MKILDIGCGTLMALYIGGMIAFLLWLGIETYRIDQRWNHAVATNEAVRTAIADPFGVQRTATATAK